MTRRQIVPGAVFAAEVVGIALLATVLGFLPVHNTAVALMSGVTAALLAQAFLPCPCHRCGGRR